MSASLVGSEMCIRDSCIARQLLELHPRPGQVDRRAARVELVHGSERRAVSYTHLTLPTICSV
eukprot:3603274-Alexandrium_andersonii.AAC.1